MQQNRNSRHPGKQRVGTPVAAQQRKEKQSGAEEEKVEGYLNLCRMNQQRRGGYYVSRRENNSRMEREGEREIRQQKKKKLGENKQRKDEVMERKKRRREGREGPREEKRTPLFLGRWNG